MRERTDLVAAEGGAGFFAPLRRQIRNSKFEIRNFLSKGIDSWRSLRLCGAEFAIRNSQFAIIRQGIFDGRS
jgi:hypothetical protein